MEIPRPAAVKRFVHLHVVKAEEAGHPHLVGKEPLRRLEVIDDEGDLVMAGSYIGIR